MSEENSVSSLLSFWDMIESRITEQMRCANFEALVDLWPLLVFIALLESSQLSNAVLKEVVAAWYDQSPRDTN